MTEPTTASGSNPPTTADRRAFPRRRPRGTAVYRPVGNAFARPTAVKLLSISQSGASFVGAAKDLWVDQQFEMVLQSPAASVPLLIVKAVVRWMVPDGTNGQFRFGCAWVDRLNYAQLIPFV